MIATNDIVYVGIDYHRNPLQVAVKDPTGRTLTNRRCSNDVEAVLELVAKHGRVGKVAIEACCGSMAFAEELAERTGWTLEIAHPGVVKRMRLNPDKSDLADAEVLADLTRSNWVPRVWLAPRRVREMRAVLHHRESLVRQRTSCKLQIRASLRQDRIVEPTARPWTRKWLTWLREEASLTEETKWLVEERLTQLNQLEEAIERCRLRLAAKAEESPLTKWLMEQRGIGLITGWWIAASVGRFDRFRRGKQLSRFCGLTPRNASSGGRQAEGGVVGTCCRVLRGKLLQAAHRLRRYDEGWKQLSARLTGSGKPINVAVVAVANRWMRKLFHQAKGLGLTA